MSAAKSQELQKFEASIFLYMFLLGSWRNAITEPDAYQPYAESLSYDNANLLLGKLFKTVWTKAIWKHSVYNLHDRGLVNLSGIASDGLESIDLSSYGCGIDRNDFDQTISKVAADLGVDDGLTIRDFTRRAEEIEMLRKIYEGAIDPKDSQTWP